MSMAPVGGSAMGGRERDSRNEERDRHESEREKHIRKKERDNKTCSI